MDVSLTAMQVWVGLLVIGAVLVAGLWHCLKRGNSLIEEQLDRACPRAGTSRAWAMSALFPAACVILTSMTFSRPEVETPTAEAAYVASPLTLRPLTQAPPLEPLASSPCAPLPLGDLDPHIRLAAKTHGISPDLLRAIIFRESSFRPCAVSASGAIGLMQLKPATATEFGVGDPFQPGENIQGGARYLRWLLARYNGNARLALGAYHAGPTVVDTHGDLSPIPKTREYVADIMNMISWRTTAEPAGD